MSLHAFAARTFWSSFQHSALPNLQARFNFLRGVVQSYREGRLRWSGGRGQKEGGGRGNDRDWLDFVPLQKFLLVLMFLCVDFV